MEKDYYRRYWAREIKGRVAENYTWEKHALKLEEIIMKYVK